MMMNLYRYPLRQNQLIIVKAHPLMSFYTNPASCISVAVFDEKHQRAALTHTLNPYVQRKITPQDCSCKPEDYINELPPMSKIKRQFIEDHADCIIDYHACHRGAFTDLSIHYLYQRFGPQSRAGYHLIGASADKRQGKKLIPLDAQIRRDLSIIYKAYKALHLTEYLPSYLSINDVNLISALSNIISRRLNLESANVHGTGIRVFDFFSATGHIVFSPKTTIRHPIILEKGEFMEPKLAEFMRNLRRE